MNHTPVLPFLALTPDHEAQRPELFSALLTQRPQAREAACDRAAPGGYSDAT